MLAYLPEKGKNMKPRLMSDGLTISTLRLSESEKMKLRFILNNLVIGIFAFLIAAGIITVISLLPVLPTAIISHLLNINNPHGILGIMMAMPILYSVINPLCGMALWKESVLSGFIISLIIGIPIEIGFLIIRPETLLHSYIIMIVTLVVEVSIILANLLQKEDYY